MEVEQLNKCWPVRNRKNAFALIAIYCGAIGLLMLISPALLITPLVTLLGLFSSLTALVLIYWPRSPYQGHTQAWIGLALSTMVFIFAGHYWAVFLNTEQWGACTSRMHTIVNELNMYAHDHDGRYPMSLDVLGLPEKSRFCKKYSFYFLHKKCPYVLNGHLAGKGIFTIEHPESTIIVAEGRTLNMKRFYRLEDMDFTDHGAVAFVGGGVEHLRRDSIPDHFPTDGKAAKDPWYITPSVK